MKISSFSQTLEQLHNLSGAVGTAGVSVLANGIGFRAGSDLGGDLEVGQGDLAGGNPGELPKHSDDHGLLLGPVSDLLGVNLADELLGAV